MGYAGVEARAGTGFADGLARARAAVAATGGSLLTREAVDRCRREASQGAVAALDDGALLAAFASRPDLLDHDDGMRDRASPRQALRGALASALFHGLERAAGEAVSAGQGPDTLPEAIAGTLDALARLESRGRRYRFLDEIRAHLPGGWLDARATALALHVEGFLSEAGLGGLANDLRAALDGREEVESRPAAPRP